MLVLSRKLNERIVIGDNIVITLVDVGHNKARIGIEAPKDMRVDREEVAKLRAAGIPPSTHPDRIET